MFNKKKDDSSDEIEYMSEPTLDPQPADAEIETPRPESSARSVSYIGAGLHMTGDIAAEENLIVEGAADGSINCIDKTLTVGKSGRVSGRIVGSVIELRGKVDGEIYSHEIVRLYSSAVIDGAIYCKRLVMDENAVFNGMGDMNWYGARPQEAPEPADESIEKVVKAVK